MKRKKPQKTQVSCRDKDNAISYTDIGKSSRTSGNSENRIRLEYVI